MRRIAVAMHVKAAAGVAIGLIAAIALSGQAWGATVVRLSWSANTEPDLAGYRLLYGTASGRYDRTVDVGKATSTVLEGLTPDTSYYFVLKAYDFSGNTSPASAEVSGRPTVVAGALPTVSTALETSTASIYVMQSGQHNVRVDGTNFQGGAAVEIGTDITEGSTSISGTTRLALTVNVTAGATLGPRAVTVTNPDTGSATRASALRIVRNADINRSCQVDGVDLNLLARSWNTTSGDAAYSTASDLDGVNGVDGDDLAIFIEYFGQRLATCP